MQSTALDWWGTTISAQGVAAPGLGDSHWGQVVCSLAAVIALVILLAWVAKKTGLAKNTSTAAEEKILLYNRFNAQQTLVVSDLGRRLRFIIYRGQHLEMAMEVPKESERVQDYKSQKTPGSFQAIWLKLIGWKGKE
jgi:flagellar biogenesis protein FliO